MWLNANTQGLQHTNQMSILAEISYVNQVK